jgi:hypothetical protein
MHNTDGRTYEGEMKNGNPHGLGRMKSQTNQIVCQAEYNEGNIHGFFIEKDWQGWYWKNKWHGLMMQRFLNDEDEYSLFEKGKRIHTFTDTEVEQIRSGKLDFATFFKHLDSSTNIIRPQTFEGPKGFRERVNEVAD